MFMTLMSILAQAVTPVVPSAGSPATSGGLVSTVLDLVMKGGWIMIPLGLCSLVAVTLVVERVIVTRAAKIVPPALLATVRKLRAHPRQALAACVADPSPLAKVLAAGIKARGQPDEIQEKQLSEAGQREIQKLRLRMRLLSALPQTATMLGLLGTVLGMIRTFTVVAASGESLGKTERLAQGIYEAWTATAAGLVIAIPTLVAYHMIMARIDAAAAALDLAVVQWREKGEIEVEAEAPEVKRSIPINDGELALAKA